jgi:hypothetical protein
MTKICNVCQYELPVEDFYTNKRFKDGLRKECKPCGLKLNREYYQRAEVKEKHNEYQRKRYRDNPDLKKRQHLKYKYGITLEEYKQKIQEQGYKCYICKADKPGGNGTYFYVDHNHATGQVRDLLCHNCNYVIGYAKENKDILLSVIEYLSKWEVQS